MNLRSKHIESLFSSFPSTRVLNPSSFELSLQNLTLVVFLPPSFPLIPPIISQNGTPLSNIPKLSYNGWSQHLSLGKLVLEIFQTLQTEQPPPSFQLTQMQPQMQLQMQSQMQQQMQPMPLYKGNEEYPDLMGISIEELEELLNDENAFTLYFNNLPAILRAEKSKDEFLYSNEVLSEKTIEKEKNFLELKQRVKKLLETHAEFKKQYDESSQTYSREYQRFTPENSKKILNDAIDSCKTQAESILQKFYDGELPVELFTKQYLQCQKSCHSMIVKTQHFQ